MHGHQRWSGSYVNCQEVRDERQWRYTRSWYFTFSVNGGTAVSFEADGQNDLTVNAGTYSVTEPAVAVIQRPTITARTLSSRTAVLHMHVTNDDIKQTAAIVPTGTTAKDFITGSYTLLGQLRLGQIGGFETNQMLLLQSNRVSSSIITNCQNWLLVQQQWLSRKLTWITIGQRYRPKTSACGLYHADFDWLQQVKSATTYTETDATLITESNVARSNLVIPCSYPKSAQLLKGTSINANQTNTYTFWKTINGILEAGSYVNIDVVPKI